MSKDLSQIYNDLHPACTLGSKAQTEGCKPVCINGIAHVLHQLLVIMQVVDGVQLRPQDFAHAV